MIDVGQKGLILLMTSITDSKTKHFFSLLTRRLAESFDGLLNSSLVSTFGAGDIPVQRHVQTTGFC